MGLRRWRSDRRSQRFVAWYERGAYAVDGVVFDVGIQTSNAILAMRQGIPALATGFSDDRANGNGSLMRALPLGLWHRGSDAELCADAATSSRNTHAHLRSQVCCEVYALWVRRLLAGAAPEKSFDDAVAAFRAVHGSTSPAVVEFETKVWPENAGFDLSGSGYVVESFRAAIALGHDTDTTACVAGGIAGLVHGVNAIPNA